MNTLEVTGYVLTLAGTVVGLFGLINQLKTLAFTAAIPVIIGVGILIHLN